MSISACVGHARPARPATAPPITPVEAAVATGGVLATLTAAAVVAVSAPVTAVLVWVRVVAGVFGLRIECMGGGKPAPASAGSAKRVSGGEPRPVYRAGAGGVRAQVAGGRS